MLLGPPAASLNTGYRPCVFCSVQYKAEHIFVDATRIVQCGLHAPRLDERSEARRGFSTCVQIRSKVRWSNPVHEISIT